MTASLEFEHMTKQFPGVVALDDISFAVGASGIHGLMGENGAGKSTLLKILSGAYRPTSGQLKIDGSPKQFRNTAEAIEAGIAVIYQELQLVPELSVAENLMLGHLPSRWGVVDRRKLLDRATHHLKSLGEDIDPLTKVKDLSIAQRQMVEISKALTHEARIIAFDEPTSSLSEREVRRLFFTIRDLKARGRAILYVSHRIEEIFELCDTITVFRDGRLVKQHSDASQVTRDMLVADMVGRPIKNIYEYRERARGELLLEVNGLEGKGLKAPASFQVHRGEILGFFGLVGAGRTELMKLIFGAVPNQGGGLKLEGRAVRFRSVRDAIAEGVVLCPEDRKLEGIIPIRSVLENINLTARKEHSWARFILKRSWETGNAERFVRELRIKTPTLHQLILNLSGGNQQKAILARWLGVKNKVLLMDEPTRGIDVGAKNEIYQLIYQLAERNLGIVVVSSDLPEILGICDRIIVMREGRLVASVAREQATQETILSLALPVSDQKGDSHVESSRR
jgi:L-arabinose transport system ATP-binding protein